MLVIIANKFYDLLMHGFMHIEEVDLLIFDECHHADQDHPYNLIMRDFWFHNFDPDRPLAVKRPKVLGLTASPIKQKIDRLKVQSTEIELMLQNLSNNLYARFVTMAPSEISRLEKDLEILIKPYLTNFERLFSNVHEIETTLIHGMSKLVRFPAQCYSMTDFANGMDPLLGKTTSKILSSTLLDSSRSSLVNLVRNEVQAEFLEEQDTHVLKFLNGRKQMIELNNSFTKEHLSIHSFSSYEDKVLLIFCIIIVKNINNLMLELGPLAVKTFFLDLKKDLLSSMQKKESNRGGLGLKSEEAIKLIDAFCQG